MDIYEIFKKLPHRFPFLLVDRVLEMDENHVVAIKNVSINEPFFQGHFPAQPVMPGVLIIEALAQASGIMLITRLKDFDNKMLVIAGIKNAKFRKQVIPGDQLVLKGEVTRFGKHFSAVKAHAYVGDHIVAEAEIMSAVADRF
ncbi:3-hydroxyacyl-ACP dehydratase FabZ [bacterium]|nr:3-hydroxyacyl-ACP dehydratase FabZ [bacterium]